MAMNRIPFKRGLSIAEFLERYGAEAQCAAASGQARWPAGFRCPRCEGITCSRVRGHTHSLFQHQSCLHQTSLIVGNKLMQAMVEREAR